MKAKKDIIINNKYYDLLVLKIDPENPGESGKHVKYICECKCGVVSSIRSTTLRNSIKNNCGVIYCIHKKYKDLSGLIIENIEILEEDGFDYRYNRKRRKWKYKCLICGKIKSECADVLTRGDITSCGSHMPSGINHWAYNPNKDRTARNCLDHTKWSRSILEIGGFRCVVCHQNKNLKAHHLDGYHWCKERRLDKTNGACVCHECHWMFHRKYGNRNNTEQQFKEFLSKYRLT